MLHIIIQFLMGGLFLLCPICAHSQTALVSLGKYELVFDNIESIENAQLVADKLTEAFVYHGWQVVSVKEQCTNKTCISTLTDSLHADAGFFIYSRQIGGKYEFTLVTAKGGRFTKSITGSLNKALHLIHLLAQQAIQNHPSPAELTPTSEVEFIPPAEEVTSTTQHQTATLPAQNATRTNKTKAPFKKKKPNIIVKKKLHLQPIAPSISQPIFWTSASITTALCISLLIVESHFVTTYNELKDQSSQTRNPSRIKELENMQIAARILFIGTLAGVATTTIFGFFTNFRSTETARLSVAPAWNKEMGGVLVQGIF